MLDISKEEIKLLSYTDFIALINQTNVPPGSFSTLTKWKNNSNINANSKVLEVACTTGFSINNLVRDTGCRGVGVDISTNSVKQARINAKEMGISELTNFHALDATQFDHEHNFTHVVVGAGLGFFPQPKIMLDKINELFGEEGLLLASPFYTIDEIPAELLRRAKGVFGITPTTARYKEVMALYMGYDILFEDRLVPEMETEEELAHYCDSTISRASEFLNIKDTEVYEALYQRLYDIKKCLMICVLTKVILWSFFVIKNRSIQNAM